MTPPHAGEFILNVNDDPAARYLVTRILEKAGFAIREASGGLDALAMARQRPRLIVLDVHLPDVDGLEVCRRLKADPLTAGIPVLQTSAAFVSTERRVLGLESGADGYLTQPIEAPELIATVRALLRADTAEGRLRDTAVEWQRTFDALDEAVMIVDRDGTVMRGNRALQQLTGGDAFTGRPVAALFGTSAAAALDVLLQQVRVSSERESGELEFDRRWFTVTVDRIPQDDPASGDRFVIVLSDISATRLLAEEERRQARDLVEANVRKDRFLAMLAHELRNPLNAIASANALSEQTGPKDESSIRLRAIIARQTRHLARLVDDLLEASRYTRGKIALQRQRLGLLDVIDAAVQANSSLAESRAQRIQLERPAGTITVDGDPLRLEQIFGNVIQNALKYSEPGSPILVRCEHDGQTASVRIIDEGIGIPAEHLKSIFELFAQVDNSLARSVGGLGIGLTLARALVEMHDGTIEATSEGIGKGTEIVVRLPLAEALVTEASPGQLEPAVHRPLTIVIIEDNDDAAELLGTLLRMWNHRIHHARDGITGLHRAFAVCPDVALIDIGLPGIDGYQVAENLRAAPATRDTYLVAITGYGRPEDRARALAAGFDRYLVKPIDFEALEEALTAATVVVAARQ